MLVNWASILIKLYPAVWLIAYKLEAITIRPTFDMIIFDGAASTTNKPVRDDYPPIKYYYIMILLSTNPKSLIFFQKYSNWYHWAFSEHDGKAEVCCSGLSGINLWKGPPLHFYERLFVLISFNPLPLHVLIWSYVRDRSWF